MGDVHPHGNPHYWVDPENGRVIARAIAARLSELDPAGKATYEANLAAFEAKLSAKEKLWEAAMAPYAGIKVVTYHESWPNFAKRFKLDIVGEVEPKPGIPPSPSHTLEIINLMTADKVPLILVEPYFDLKTPRFIADKAGATVTTFYPSVGGTSEIKDYFDLFDVDISAFVKAMQGRR
jgi:zinc/manganese transport system substrate-binding protein